MDRIESISLAGRDVWEGVDGGVLLSSETQSVREFAESIVTAIREGNTPLLEILFEDESASDDASELPDGELVGIFEEWISANGPDAYQVPSEIAEDDRWDDARGILSAAIEDPSLPGYLKIISVSY